MALVAGSSVGIGRLRVALRPTPHRSDGHLARLDHALADQHRAVHRQARRSPRDTHHRSAHRHRRRTCFISSKTFRSGQSPCITNQYCKRSINDAIDRGRGISSRVMTDRSSDGAYQAPG